MRASEPPSIFLEELNRANSDILRRCISPLVSTNFASGKKIHIVCFLFGCHGVSVACGRLLRHHYWRQTGRLQTGYKRFPPSPAKPLMPQRRTTNYLLFDILIHFGFADAPRTARKLLDSFSCSSTCDAALGGQRWRKSWIRGKST